MVKTIRKALCLLLSFAMVLAYSVPSFAEEQNGTDENAGVTGEYKVVFSDENETDAIFLVYDENKGFYTIAVSLTAGDWKLELQDSSGAVIDRDGAVVGEGEIGIYVITYNTDDEYMKCSKVEIPEEINADTWVRYTISSGEEGTDSYEVVAESYMLCTDSVAGVYERVVSGLKAGTYKAAISYYTITGYDYDTGEAAAGYQLYGYAPLSIEETAGGESSDAEYSVKLSLNMSAAEEEGVFTVTGLGKDETYTLRSFINGEVDYETQISWSQYSDSDIYLIGYWFYWNEYTQTIKIFDSSDNVVASTEINIEDRDGMVIVNVELDREKEEDAVTLSVEELADGVNATNLRRVIIEDTDGHEIKTVNLAFNKTASDTCTSALVNGLEPGTYRLKAQEYNGYNNDGSYITYEDKEAELGSSVLLIDDGWEFQALDPEYAYHVEVSYNGEHSAAYWVDYDEAASAFYIIDYVNAGKWKYELYDTYDHFLSEYEYTCTEDDEYALEDILLTFDLKNCALTAEQVEMPRETSLNTEVYVTVASADDRENEVNWAYMFCADTNDKWSFVRTLKSLKQGEYVISVYSYEAVGYDFETGQVYANFVLCNEMNWTVEEEDASVKVTYDYVSNDLKAEDVGANEYYYLNRYHDGELIDTEIIEWSAYTEADKYVRKLWYGDDGTTESVRLEVTDSTGKVVASKDIVWADRNSIEMVYIFLDVEKHEADIVLGDYPEDITLDTVIKAVVSDEDGNKAAEEYLTCIGYEDNYFTCVVNDLEPGIYTVDLLFYRFIDGYYVYDSQTVELSGNAVITSKGWDWIVQVEDDTYGAYYADVYKNGEYRTSLPFYYDEEEDLFYAPVNIRSGDYEFYLRDKDGDLISTKQASYGVGDKASVSYIIVTLDPDTFEMEMSDDYFPDEININNMVKIIVTANDGSEAASEYLSVQDDDEYIFGGVINGLEAGRYEISVLVYDAYDGYVTDLTKSVDVSEGKALSVSYDLSEGRLSISETAAVPDNSQNTADNNQNSTDTAGNTDSKNSTDSAVSTSAPKTGDSFKLELYFLMLMISGAFAAAVCLAKKADSEK